MDLAVDTDIQSRLEAGHQYGETAKVMDKLMGVASCFQLLLVDSPCLEKVRTYVHARRT
jgi:hypothetical protein